MLSQKETELKMKETDRIIKELGKQIGGLGNSFGRFTEGLLGPSIRKILEEKFSAEYVVARLGKKLNGEQIEIDYFGACNGNINKAFVVEVKTALELRDIIQLKKAIKLLPQIMPEQKGKNVVGLIAAASYTEEQKKKVLENGFYFLKITNEIAKLDVPKNFKPKIF